MQTGTYDFEIPQGASVSQAFTITGYNLTSWTAKLQARTSYESTTAFITLTNGSGITLGNGTFQIDFTYTQTEAFPVGKSVYDLEITNGATRYRIIQGNFVVTPQVTL
jgi:hypothetical protein